MRYSQRRRHILNVVKDLDVSSAEVGEEVVNRFQHPPPPEDVAASIFRVAGWIGRPTPLRCMYLWGVLSGETRDELTLDEIERELRERGHWEEPPSMWQRFRSKIGL